MAWGYGSEELSAPQATLMKMVVEGVMDGNLPWTFVIAGAFIAIVVDILGIPVLPFAVGLYLPIHLSVPIMIGGLIRWVFDKNKNSKESVEKGILYSSGLIAGEGLVGIILAVLAVIPFKNGVLSDVIDISGVFGLGGIGSIVFFILIILSFWGLKRKSR